MFAFRPIELIISITDKQDSKLSDRPESALHPQSALLSADPPAYTPSNIATIEHIDNGHIDEACLVYGYGCPLDGSNIISRSQASLRLTNDADVRDFMSPRRPRSMSDVNDHKGGYLGKFRSAPQLNEALRQLQDDAEEDSEGGNRIEDGTKQVNYYKITFTTV